MAHRSLACCARPCFPGVAPRKWSEFPEDTTNPHPDQLLVASALVAFACMPRREKPHAYAVRIGQRLRELREEKGLTMEKLAYESDLGSKGHISSLERGLMVPTVETIRAIAERLEVLPLDLLCFPEDGKREELIELSRSLSEAELDAILAELRRS